MLTGLCGKSWRQKYLPSDGHYTWEYFNADRDAENHRNCGYIGYFFHFSHFIFLFSLFHRKYHRRIIKKRSRPSTSSKSLSFFFLFLFFRPFKNYACIELARQDINLFERSTLYRAYLCEKDTIHLVYSLKKYRHDLSSIERSLLFKSLGEQ